MTMKDNRMYQHEKLYIAGPECFYPRGYSLWHSLRKYAEYKGFEVVLPNDTPLELDHQDLRLNANAIFQNLEEVLEQTTIIMADLEVFRSPEPDCGTLFEMGAVFAKGGLVYGYTRDKRVLSVKTQGCCLIDGIICDQKGRKHPYPDLPFSPSVVASTKILEGTFSDCMNVLIADLEEKRKRITTTPKSQKIIEISNYEKRIYVSGPARYSVDANDQFDRMKEICARNGFEGVSPFDGMQKDPNAIEDPLRRAVYVFDHWQKVLDSCGIFLGDLSDYQGYEPCNDTAFEAGVAWKKGKKCFGYMPAASCMRERIPNHEGLDVAGNIVENFNYPINLMFSSSMPIIEGDFEQALNTIASTFGDA